MKQQCSLTCEVSMCKGPEAQTSRVLKPFSMNQVLFQLTSFGFFICGPELIHFQMHFWGI